MNTYDETHYQKLTIYNCLLGTHIEKLKKSLNDDIQANPCDMSFVFGILKQMFIIKNEKKTFVFFVLPNFDPEENIGKKRPI